MHVGGSAESIYDTRIADVEILISLLFNEMYQDKDEQLKIKIYDTDKALLEQLAAGNLDAVFMNPVLYIDNIEYLDSDHTYAAQHGPTIKPKYILLVRQDSGIDSLQELQNKKLIIPSGHNVGKLFLDVELLRAELPVSEELFSEIRLTRETNAAIVDLFFGKVDAALVTDFSYDVACELNRQISQTLKIIRTSPPLIHLVVSVRKGFPPQKVIKYLPFTDAFTDQPRLHYFKKTFRFSGVQKIDPEDVREMYRLNEAYLQLKNKNRAQ